MKNQVIIKLEHAESIQSIRDELEPLIDNIHDLSDNEVLQKYFKVGAVVKIFPFLRHSSDLDLYYLLIDALPLPSDHHHIQSEQHNFFYSVYSIPNDPFYTSQGSWNQSYDDLWALKNLEVEPAWEITKGQGVTVAVVDTGIRLDHPELSPNMWINPGEIPDNFIDDDQNG